MSTKPHPENYDSEIKYIHDLLDWRRKEKHDPDNELGFKEGIK